jgi:drug/metabolite transporter (DMT)-like permease
MNVNASELQARTLSSNERAGKMYMLAAMVIAGTIGYFVLLSGQRPLNVVFFRCAIGAIGLSLYCWHKGFFQSLRFSTRQLANIALGALTLTLNWYFLFTAYGLTSVGVTTVVYNVQPFLLVLAGLLFRKERPSLSAVVWLTMAFCGVVILAHPSALQVSSTYLLGIGSALAAATLYAATTMLTKNLSNTIRPEVIAACHMIVGTIAFAPLADFHHLPTTAEHVFAIIALGLFHTTFMYILLYGAFKKAATSSIAVLGFVYPLVAVLVDFLAFGKVMNREQLIGGALILAAATAYATGFSPKKAIKAFPFNRAARNK